MPPRVPEPETNDQISQVALWAVRALNAVGLVLMIAAWPVLALVDLFRRPAPVTIIVAPENLPQAAIDGRAYLADIRQAA